MLRVSHDFKLFVFWVVVAWCVLGAYVWFNVYDHYRP